MGLLKNTLTFTFDTLGIVSLQYVPSDMVLSEQSMHQTLQALNGKVSIISPIGTQMRDITIGCYFTALLAPDDFENIGAILGTQGIAIGLAAAGTLGSDKVLSAINNVRKTVSLAKGVFDLR